MSIGRLILRTSVGGLFVGHGTQKLFGWFGGGGIDQTAGFFDAIGIRPGRTNAIAAGAAEAGGGALLALGLATPVAATVLTSTMLTAIHRVHLKNGPWITKQGYEYNLVLIAAALALAETGPGSLSLDEKLGIEVKGPKVAFAALAAGVIGAVGAHAYAASQPEPAPASAPEAEAAAAGDGGETVSAAATAE
jgi:putative oxidoreductase